MRSLWILVGLSLPVPVLAADGAAPPGEAEHAPSAPLPLASGPGTLTPAESMAWRELRDVVTRERAIWDRLRERPGDEHEQQRANAEFRHVMTAYENVIRIAPNFAEAYAAYGLLLSRTGNREEALRVFLKANQLNANLPMVKNQIGNVLFEDGRYKEALGYYLAAIELKDDEPLYHYQLGCLLREYRRFFIADALFGPETLDTKMQTAFRRAAELAPDTWGYIYRYAESFYDLETPDWPGALEAWTRLEARAQPGVERQAIRLHQAHVLARLGRHQEARTVVDSIVEPALLANKEAVLALIAALEAGPEEFAPEASTRGEPAAPAGQREEPAAGDGDGGPSQVGEAPAAAPDGPPSG